MKAARYTLELSRRSQPLTDAGRLSERNDCDQSDANTASLSTAGALEVDLLCAGDKRGATPGGGPQPHGDALKIDAPPMLARHGQSKRKPQRGLVARRRAEPPMSANRFTVACWIRCRHVRVAVPHAGGVTPTACNTGHRVPPCHRCRAHPGSQSRGRLGR